MKACQQSSSWKRPFPNNGPAWESYWPTRPATNCSIRDARGKSGSWAKWRPAGGSAPFSGVLRLYQGLGNLLGGAALARARSPIQVALWGAAAGGRVIQQRRRRSQASSGVARAMATSWDAGELRTAAIILDGYAGEAGFSNEDTSSTAIQAQAVEASAAFVPQAAAQLQKVISTLAEQHTGWFTRLRYEVLLLAMIGVIVYRLGKNFFYDSWLAPEPTATYGWDFFVHAAFWLVAWSALLLWMFTSRLRRGLRGKSTP